MKICDYCNVYAMSNDNLNLYIFRNITEDGTKRKTMRSNGLENYTYDMYLIILHHFMFIFLTQIKLSEIDVINLNC